MALNRIIILHYGCLELWQGLKPKLVSRHWIIKDKDSIGLPIWLDFEPSRKCSEVSDVLHVIIIYIRSLAVVSLSIRIVRKGLSFLGLWVYTLASTYCSGEMFCFNSVSANQKLWQNVYPAKMAYLNISDVGPCRYLPLLVVGIVVCCIESSRHVRSYMAFCPIHYISVSNLSKSCAFISYS